MVAIVSSKAKRQLRHITRPDNQGIVLVRHIHQNLRALPSLRIFISHILQIKRMTDIAQMQPHSFLNFYLAECCFKRLHKRAGICVSAPGRAETRHGNCKDSRLIKSRKFKGMTGDKERQG